jgi:hydrogenase nickel incorporation protein HypA/HybF
MASAGTIAVDAELLIDEADIVVRCGTCGAETPARANRLVCSECGDFRTTVISGDEMILQRVELETR